MSKKTFKHKTEHLDRFFSKPEEADTHVTHSSGVKKPDAKSDKNPEPRHYRLNLKLKEEYKDYLYKVSWENRKSVTQYINELIKADMDAKINQGNAN